ncbi:Panacea domain-containing protein [Symbioplanes lichenis]|uniref:Panacea domain-containing protein n=1 Tax=Symbioplanes lichenis TaxID=1629072 RepID=UPI00273998DE|nr:type II toxin-antitoxin system antitoxin SocA domain-containing protein [Actinoplanes lichenis]
MASIHDVSAYILRRVGPMSPMKLHLLLFYSQAWYLADVGEPLVPDRFEAWPPGPVAAELFEFHRGVFWLTSWSDGDPDRLTATQRASIDETVDDYGSFDEYQIGALVEREDPYWEVRRGLDPVDECHDAITEDAMLKYYSALAANEDAGLVKDYVWTEWNLPVMSSADV